MLQLHSPVSLLPAELFHNILFLLAGSDPEPDTPWNWAVVTHVCRAWRYRALTCQLLWAHIDFAFGGKAWAEECLQRACTVPLDIVQPARVRHASAFRAILGKEPAVRSLHVRRANECVGTLETVLARPAPSLQALHLSTTDKQLLNFTMFLPRNLFSGRAPNLCSLELHGYVFQWNTLAAFPRLERLVLTKVSPRYSTSHTLIRPRDRADMEYSEWSDIIPALSALSELRELRIEHCWPRSLPEPADLDSRDEPLLNLRRLEQMSLAGFPAHCAWFLRRTTLPPNLSVTCLSSTHTIRADVDQVAPHVAHRLAGDGMKSSLSNDAGMRIAVDTTMLAFDWDRTLALGVGQKDAYAIHAYALNKLGLNAQAKMDFTMEWEEDWGDNPTVMMSGFF